eukprot:TRINITY_DN1755_c0_g2_i1.p1 TRINITY_DN1755_c0_g2~~TRINITY_DN1755_c0_g2_i1.p1  ORF type:complete len:226 (-),score=50.82 TRINITY_DN1755_c0_g2_i1:397-1074(-)
MKRVAVLCIIAVLLTTSHRVFCSETADEKQNVADAESKISDEHQETLRRMEARHRGPRDYLGKMNREDLKRRYLNSRHIDPDTIPDISEDDVQMNPHLRRLYDDYKAGKFDKRHPAYRHLAEVALQRAQDKDQNKEQSNDAPHDPLADLHQRMRRERPHPMRKIEEDLLRYRRGQHDGMDPETLRDLKAKFAAREFPGGRPHDLVNDPENAPNAPRVKDDEKQKP